MRVATIRTAGGTCAVRREGDTLVETGHVGVGAHDDIPLPAEAAIAGFTVVDDISCRDWQMRTGEWLQGKTWDSSTPVGPYLVAPDELPGGVRPEIEVSLHVDGVLRQRDSAADLLFDPVALVEHISTVVRLNPGDIIATGTPGGVGHGMTPPTYLAQGQVVVAEVEGIGALTNRVVADPTA
ncbi:fumarylacetoacetate hydrolase family protein [Janibacter melonis]|uniref:fumarylacetoacetate hydrolase family protein n=1 Tax=Janibacter melonis TaxID=262209 RepID=UPI00177BB5DF|nr:fumarylacetoacetate hydrolase family protein [Janibacter melonis]